MNLPKSLGIYESMNLQIYESMHLSGFPRVWEYMNLWIYEAWKPKTLISKCWALRFKPKALYSKPRWFLDRGEARSAPFVFSRWLCSVLFISLVLSLCLSRAPLSLSVAVSLYFISLLSLSPSLGSLPLPSFTRSFSERERGGINREGVKQGRNERMKKAEREKERQRERERAREERQTERRYSERKTAPEGIGL